GLLLGGHSRMSQKALVIVPTYNERDNLPPLVERLMKLPTPVEILVVDDNSPDGTGKVADEIAARNPMVHVLHRQEKNGPSVYCRVQMGFGTRLRIHLRDGWRFFA